MTPQRFREIIWANVRICINEIASNKLRSFITSLGIFLGIAAVLIDMSMIRSMDDKLKEQMARIGGLNVLTVQTKAPEDDAEKIRFSMSPGMTIDDGYALVKAIPGIKDVIRKKDLHWQGLSAAGNSTGSRANAVDHNYLSVYNYTIGTGRPFTEDDFIKKKQVCILGSDIATTLFGQKEKAIRKKVSMWNIPFTCIGLITTTTKFDQRNREILIPITVYQNKVSASNKEPELLLLIKNVDDIPVLKPAIEQVLTSRHRGAQDFEVTINQDKINEMKSTSSGMQIILLCIAGISLLAGGISIMNIMFATIGDRIREIGIRKALGAQNADLLMQFLIEAVLLCCVGGLPGLILGAAITLLPKGLFPFDPRLIAADYILALSVAMGVGLISGLFPALKAARMQPVEALRY